MVKITGEYQGDLHCVAQHESSGNTLVTDAPKDNQGRGEAFSPTDLVATALASCILTTMGIVARRHPDWDLTGATAVVTKEMVSAPTRRIGKLAVRIHIPSDLPTAARQALELAAHTCPVHKSLHPDVEAPIEFSYGPAAS